jgi:integrative and conjugative element protein (TIGR02256 family)
MPVANEFWVSLGILDQCADEANIHFPLETGGVFMGYWSNDNDVVVTAMIGPGPSAKRGQHFFEPDHEWQLAQIASNYGRSGGYDTYLGDWHSHPNSGSGQLSWVDTRVLRKLIKAPNSRTLKPIMAILHGSPEQWNFSAHMAQLLERKMFWSRLITVEATVKVFV